MGPIGFIGVGKMGAAMAARLLQRGATLVVCDPDPAACAALARAGAAVADTPRAVADQVPLAFACLPSGEISEQVALGPAGLVHGRTLRTYVETSTIGQQTMEHIARGLDGHGIDTVDAPVSGGPDGAAAGRLATVAAGPAAARARAAAAIASYAGTCVDAGPRAGMAQVFKLVNQGLTFASVALTAEAMAMGVKAGADARALLDFLNAGTARNWATAVKFPQSVLTRTFGHGHLGIVRKDLQLYLELCRRSGTPALMGGQAAALFELVESLFPGQADLASVVRLYETFTGAPVGGAATASNEEPR